MKSIWVYVSVTAGLMSCAFLTSCGGAADPPYDSPGGYWIGSWNGEPGVALMDESGEFTFIADDGEQYTGALLISGDSFTGTVNDFTPGAFPNYGTYYLCGGLSGAILPGQSVSGTATCETPEGPVIDAFSWTFSALYNVPSSLATISGTYVDSATGTAFTISADGAVFAQDASTGCVINGTVSIINASYDIYDITVSYASCTGSLTVLNGVTLAGLAALNNSASPEQLVAGVWSTVQPAPLSVTYRLVRS
jgi:hypothetical protein